MGLPKNLLAVLLVGSLNCGCKMVSGVKSSTEAIDANRQAIEESTAGVQAIGHAITNSLPALEAARHQIEEAAQAIAAAGQPIQTTTVAVEQARVAIEDSGKSLVDIGVLLSRSSESIEETRRRVEQSSQGIEANRIAIEASTRSILENEATVNRSTAALTRIGHVLQDILDAGDRLTAKQSLLAALIAGAVMLVLLPALVFVVFLWKLGHTLAALAARIVPLENLPASASQGGVPKPISQESNL